MAAAILPLDTSQISVKKFDGLDPTYRPDHFLEAIEEKMIQTHGAMDANRLANDETTSRWNQRVATFSAWLSGPAKQWFRRKTPAEKENWVALTAEFVNLFTAGNFRIYGQTKAMAMKKSKKETTRQYLMRVDEAVTTGWGNYPNDYQLGKGRDIFVAGLPPNLKKCANKAIIHDHNITSNDLATIVEERALTDALTYGSEMDDLSEEKTPENDGKLEKIEQLLSQITMQNQQHTVLGNYGVYGAYDPGYNARAYDPGNYPRFGNQAKKFCNICKRSGHTPYNCFQHPRHQANQSRGYSFRPQGMARGINRGNYGKLFTPTNARGMMRVRPQGGFSGANVDPGTGMPRYNYNNTRFRGPQGPHATITSGRPGSCGINLNPSHRGQRPQGGTVDYAYRGGRPSPANAGPLGHYQGQSNANTYYNMGEYENPNENYEQHYNAELNYGVNTISKEENEKEQDNQEMDSSDDTKSDHLNEQSPK